MDYPTELLEITSEEMGILISKHVAKDNVGPIEAERILHNNGFTEKTLKNVERHNKD